MNKRFIDVVWEGPSQCESCEIRDLVLCSSLKNEEFALIHKPIEKFGFRKDEYLYRTGELADYLYIVREGIVKLVQNSPNGDMHILRLLRCGDVAGLEAMIEQTYHDTAVALENMVACRIPITVIKKLDEHLPLFHQQLLKKWQRSIDEANAWLVELRTGPIKARVARLLLRLAGAETTTEILLPSVDDIAAIIAVSPQHVSRVIAKFKRAGLVNRVAVHRFNVDVDAFRTLVS